LIWLLLEYSSFYHRCTKTRKLVKLFHVQRSRRTLRVWRSRFVASYHLNCLRRSWTSDQQSEIIRALRDLAVNN